MASGWYPNCYLHLEYEAIEVEDANTKLRAGKTPTWEPRTVTIQEFWFGNFEAKSHVAQAGLKPMMYLRVILNS